LKDSLQNALRLRFYS